MFVLQGSGHSITIKEFGDKILAFTETSLFIKKEVFASPSLRYLTRERSLAMVLSKEARLKQSRLSSRLSQSSSDDSCLES
jgi:hypothetical protein